LGNAIRTLSKRLNFQDISKPEVNGVLRTDCGGKLTMVDLKKAKVFVELTYPEARALRSAIEAKIKKREKRLEKSGFVPEEGKLDLNMTEIDVLQAGADKIDNALTEGIAELRRTKEEPPQLFVDIAARADAAFARTSFDLLSRSDRDRYLERARFVISQVLNGAIAGGIERVKSDLADYVESKK
jgi:hypothetical protein